MLLIGYHLNGSLNGNPSIPVIGCTAVGDRSKTIEINFKILKMDMEIKFFGTWMSND